MKKKQRNDPKKQNPLANDETCKQLMDNLFYAHFFDELDVEFEKSDNDQEDEEENMYFIESAFQFLADMDPNDDQCCSPSFVFFLIHVVYALSSFGQRSLRGMDLHLLHIFVDTVLCKLVRHETRQNGKKNKAKKADQTTTVEMIAQLLDCMDILGVDLSDSTVLTEAVETKLHLRTKVDRGSVDSFHLPFCLITGLAPNKHPKTKFTPTEEQMIKNAVHHFGKVVDEEEEK